MAHGSPRRLIASLLLGTLATSLAACGIASQPTMTANTQVRAGAFAANSSIDDRRFDLQFDPQRPPVRRGTGRSRAGIPANTDLRPQLSPIDDQGRLGACTGFAITGLAEYLERKSGKTDELSPGFVYKMENNAQGTPGQDHGSRLSIGMSVMKKYGIATEALNPYIAPADQLDKKKITEFLLQKPSQEAFKSALEHRITTAKPINDLDGFKASIAAGKPVVFGIAVYSSFRNPEVKTTGVVPQPNTDTEQLLGGHAILAVGYDEAKKQVLFRNSWSPAWGDKGYGYLPYSYFDGDLVHDAWQAE